MTVAGCAFFLLALVPCLAEAQTLNLAWDASPTANISGYYIYAGTSTGNYNVLSQVVVPAGQTTYAFQATPGVKYFFAVSAFLADGTESSRAGEVIGGIPTLTQPANASGTVGTAITAVQLGGNDPDGGTLAYSAAGLPPGLSLNTATGRITGTPTTAGSFTVVAGVTDGLAPVQQRSFAWTIAPGAATITAAAASPATGTGTAQTFTLTYTDSVGAADLVTASVLFDAAQSANPANSCAVTVSPRTGLVSLLNDAGTSWASGTIGDQTTLQNSQCSLALANSSVTPSGNNLTVNLAMAFSPVFAGGKNTYLYAAGAGGQNSGWVARGNWTVPAAVLTAVSASPSTGSGTSQSFSLQYSDTAGATDIKTAWAWFATSASASSANSCLMYYERSSDSVYLLNDAGTVWASARRGASTTLQNAQCSIAARTVTATASGNLLTVAFPVTFGAAYSGAKNIFMYALGSASNTGWQDRGDWTIPAAAPPPPVTEVTVDSVTPASGGGASVTFTGQYTDTLGVTDMTAAWLWVAPSLSSPSANSCMAYYEPGTDTVHLLNDAGTAWFSASRGSATSLQNAQCSIAVADVTRTATGNRLTWSLPLTFSGNYAGAKNVYLFGAGQTLNSGWQDRGDWTIPASAAPPVATVTADSATPSAGTGTGQTFALQYTDTLGVTDLAAAWIWIAPTLSSSSANSCLAYYEPATDSVKLLNDAGAVWLSAPRGSATTLQNAQCSIAVSGVTKSAAGNVLTLNVPVTFSASYAGSKNIYLFAAGSTVNSGWQDRGDWTIPAPPAGGVSAVSASPSSGSGSAGTFALQFNDALGAADLKTAWAWFTTTNSSSSANSCLVYYDQTADTVNLLNDAATVWSWAARGSANTLQNSQCSVAVAGVTKVPAGNVMTVTIPVTFSGAYAGVKNIYLFAAGSTLNSGWQDRGDWTVPAGAPAPAVTADSVTPGSGSGSSATFALKYSSSLGASDLQAGWVWFSTSASSSSANSCLAYYEPPTDTLYLLNDAGTAWMSAKRGSTGSLRNSRCTISVAGATRSVSGNTLTLNLPVTFSGLFTGTKNIYLFGTGSSLNSGWQDRGDWTVP